MLYALGLGDRVVGVTTFCHYPPEVRDKPKIGSYLRPNIETILAMRPDLIVVLEEHSEVVSQFRSLGLPVLALQHNNLEGIYESMLVLGRRTGIEDVAARRVMEIRQALDEVRKKAAGLPRRTVMFLVGRSPGTVQDMIAVGHGSFLNELIAIAGGENLFGNAAMFYPRIPREEVYARRPDVIIDMGDMSDTDRVTEDHKRTVSVLWREQFPTLPAVSEGRVYPVANDIFVVPGPRVVETARELLAMIHPEAAP
jgi:iron complex transport system substrate-binding protein